MIRNQREGARKILRQAQQIYEDRLKSGEVDETKAKVKYVTEIKQELKKAVNNSWLIYSYWKNQISESSNLTSMIKISQWKYNPVNYSILQPCFHFSQKNQSFYLCQICLSHKKFARFERSMSLH